MFLSIYEHQVGSTVAFPFESFALSTRYWFVVVYGLLFGFVFLEDHVNLEDN